MHGKPLTMRQAWRIYDTLSGDERVEFVSEPSALERHFREFSSGSNASPKLWADGYLLALAAESEGKIVTFDRAMPCWKGRCTLLT